MGERTCPGCGAPLHSGDPAQPGFVPAEVLARDGEPAVCRRCFRLRHYGDVVGGPPDATLAWTAVRQAVKASSCLLLVTDAFDFEASISVPLEELRSKPLVVAVNKVDLLPPRTPAAEVQQWVRRRLAELGVAKADVYAVSARTGWGTRALWERLEERAGRGTVAAIGVTNVGKSALLAHWSRVLGGGTLEPTVSPVPGTTYSLLRLRLTPEGFTLLDTPGIPPRGRLSDRLCPDCARRVVPDRRLEGRLWTVKPGQALLLGGFAAVEVRGPVPDGSVLIAYGAQGLPLHRTRSERVRELLREPPRPLSGAPCSRCRVQLAAEGAVEHRVPLAHAQDLVIHGLGWLTLRGGPLTLAVQVPQGARLTVRNNLLGPKGRSGELLSAPL